MSAIQMLTDAVFELAKEDLANRQLDETPANLIQTITMWLEEYVDVPPTKREQKFFEAHEYALDILCREHHLKIPKIA